MATPPKPLNFRLEAMGDDVPDWAISMMEALNTFSSQVSQSLGGGITRADNLQGTAKTDVLFTYAGDGAAGIPVKHGLPKNPEHVVLTKIAYADGTEPVGADAPGAMAFWWRNSSDGQVLIYLQGLSTGARYRANLTFE